MKKPLGTALPQPMEFGPRRGRSFHTEINEHTRYNMDFKTYWQATYPECPAIPHLLREVYRPRWVRFHSLPESKRYAENEAEYQIILDRHNAVLDELSAKGGPLLFVSTETSDADAPLGREDSLVALDPAAEFCWTIQPYPDGGDGGHRHIFVSAWNWKPGTFDAILRLVADWKIANTMIVCAVSNWVYHPYDGGADVILPSREHRNALKSRFAGWLSCHPRGL